MKKLLRTIKYVSIALVITIIGLIGYVEFALPNVGSAENIKVQLTPERIERGNYLANTLCACMDCHSQRDWTKFSGPLVINTLGQGGEAFNEKQGFPGTYYSKNITPFAIGDWTDGELLRAISCGVNKEGKALFPIMPYLNYGKLDKEDLFSIIAYLRTLSPIENNVSVSESKFPMNLIIHAIPEKAKFSKIPDKKNTVAYGKYLFVAASCNECHTKQENGKPLKGMYLAGGFRFPLNTGGSVFSANITPDKETGIGSWSEESFVNRFKVYADSTYKPNSVNKGEFNSMMPWMMYCGIKSEDLKAIYAYLKTVKPIKNNVLKFSPNE